CGAAARITNPPANRKRWIRRLMVPSRETPEDPGSVHGRLGFGLVAFEKMAELEESALLELANALPRKLEVLARLGQGPWAVVEEAVAQTQDRLLPAREALQHVVQLLVADLHLDDLVEARRLLHGLGLDQTVERFVPHVDVQRVDRLNQGFEARHARHGDSHLARDVVMAGLASQLRLEAALGGHETPHHLKHVDRNPDRPRLVRDPAREGLPDPPPGVGAEVNAALDVESIDRGDQPEVSFLDEIEELDAAIPIAARERDDEAEVGVDDRAPGSLRAAPHRLPEGALLLALEERIALNLVQ